jgi:hypothetical protein
MWATLALTAALNLAPGADGLSFKNVRPTFGLLGQERKDTAILPGDTYVLTFDIDGLTIGKDDRIKYAMGLELLDSKGKSQFKKDEEPLEAINTLGGTLIPAFANVNIGFDTEPGEYELVVNVKDRATNMSKQLRHKFEVKKLEFGVVRLGYAYHPSFQPAPPFGIVGQTYYAVFTIVGWDLAKTTNMPDVTAEVIIHDADGKATLAAPMQGKVDTLKEEFLKVKVIPMSFPISLNRAGKFKVTINVEDKAGMKKASYSLDLTVIEPK